MKRTYCPANSCEVSYDGERPNFCPKCGQPMSKFGQAAIAPVPRYAPARPVYQPQYEDAEELSPDDLEIEGTGNPFAPVKIKEVAGTSKDAEFEKRDRKKKKEIKDFDKWVKTSPRVDSSFKQDIDDRG